jgi:hypothetical protein
MVSSPCGPSRISEKKEIIATHTMGMMSTPATGGMNLKMLSQEYSEAIVSSPCGPSRISEKKEMMATHTMGVISTPATGGMNLRCFLK